MLAKEYKFTAVVNFDNKTYLVDSCDTFDNGYELMVFRLNNYHPDIQRKLYFGKTAAEDTLDLIGDDVFSDTDYTGLYSEQYDTIEEAERGFNEIVNDFGSIYEVVAEAES